MLQPYTQGHSTEQYRIVQRKQASKQGNNMNINAVNIWNEKYSSIFKLKVNNQGGVDNQKRGGEGGGGAVDNQKEKVVCVGGGA